MNMFHGALFFLVVGCANASPPRREDTGTSTPPGAGGADTVPNKDATCMHIRVGTAVFSATFEANETASAFKTMLPLTLDLADLHENEKYADLPRSIPVDA